MSVKISQLPSVSEVLGSDVAPSVQDGTTKKFSMTTLANYLLNTFNSLSLGGTARTVKAAIDAIHTSLSSLLTKVGNVTMGTTATTITGAIAEHESDISTINASLSYTTYSDYISDFNNAINCSRQYYGDANTAHRPGDGWWFIKPIGKSGQMVVQIAMKMNVLVPSIYIRSSNNNGVFGSWTQIS